MSLFFPRRRRSGDVSATLFLPRKDRGDSGSRPSSLPPELSAQAARRLRLIAFIYSAAFFLADTFPQLVTGHVLDRFQRPGDWVWTFLSIVGGLAVAVLAGSPLLSSETKINLGLVFQVVASYGIALSMYAEVEPGLPEVVFHVLSPSWVGIWMLFYTIVVPAPPGRALLALLASASASPLVIGISMTRLGYWSAMMSPLMFFFMHVFPYMLC